MPYPEDWGLKYMDPAKDTVGNFYQDFNLMQHSLDTAITDYRTGRVISGTTAKLPSVNSVPPGTIVFRPDLSGCPYHISNGTSWDWFAGGVQVFTLSNYFTASTGWTLGSTSLIMINGILAGRIGISYNTAVTTPAGGNITDIQMGTTNTSLRPMFNYLALAYPYTSRYWQSGWGCRWNATGEMWFTHGPGSRTLPANTTLYIPVRVKMNNTATSANAA